MKPLAPRRTAVVSALDIGTSKIACLIARLKPAPAQNVFPRRTHLIEILGIGHTRAAGIKNGTVADMAEAERAVRNAVAAAERMAGVELDSVVVSVSAGRLSSELFAATVHASGPTVSDSDIERVLAAGSRHSLREHRAVLHSMPIGYALDDTRGVRDPRGMLGRRLGVDMHVVTVDTAVVRNLMLCIERCHLSVEAMVATPYVAGLSVLTDDESDLGSAVVDMGAGTTTIAVFSGGHFVHCDGFALGGRHVTMDLARGLNARIADAERVKTIHGSVLSGGSDEHDMIPLGSALDDGESSPAVARATIVNIVKPRAEEILEMVRDKLAASPFAAEPRGRVVLTGGACQLNGLPDLASRILGRQVRIGRPLGLSGLPEAAKGPAFAVAAGLLVYPQTAHLEHFEPRRGRNLAAASDSYFARVGRWLRESF
ncbi:MAG TPA: cell division protein FtsA [Xanthobacteraceae bacterium]|nr:cell division protein FtsA [Xanthobacteraceae bacterium]